MRWQLAALDFDAKMLRLGLALKANFDPNQPRVPAGRPDGGQWTRVEGYARESDGGNAEQATIAQAETQGGFAVDLLEEESLGGHTIQRHVGRSPQSLLARVRGQSFFGLFYTIATRRAGSFPSIMAATKLVNATLAQNHVTVDQVARGILASAFVTAVFTSKTGIEAYRPTLRAQPYIRDTFGVGVSILHDPSTSNGFRVVRAYPRND